LFFALLAAAVLRSPSLMSNAGIGSASIVATPLILATYAILPTVMAGRVTVDLSIGPLIGFINVTLVRLLGLEIIANPVEVFAYALGVGILYQIIVALIVIYVRVQPIIVALSGYLALSGINLVIMVRPEGTVPDWMSSWGLGTSILSPVTVILIVGTAAWLLFTLTPFYGHLRLMGADERAAYASGVRINIVRLGAHIISGIYAALAALTYTSLIGSGDPTQGTTYTLIAVTALVLGGASLSGGRGSVIGSLLGAINIYLITYVLATFSFGKIQSFVTDLSYGVVLVISLLLTMILPFIRTTLRSLSPLLYFVVLSLIAVGIIIHATYNYSSPAPTGAAAGDATEAAQSTAQAATKSSAPEASTPAAARRVPGPFIFETVRRSPVASDSGPNLAWPITEAAILILALLLILRVTVAEVRSGSLSPLIYVVVIAVALLGLYLVTNRSDALSAGAAPPARSDQ
jgi:ribose transport system permease protein